MKASELIELLQRQVEVFGDLDVVLWNDLTQGQVRGKGAGTQIAEGTDKPVIEIWGGVLSYELPK